MINIGLIGKSGRFDCLADSLSRSAHSKKLHALCDVNNPGVVDKTEGRLIVGKTDQKEVVEEWARGANLDFVVIGPEEPLAAGIVDMLMDKLGIPCVGPRQKLAKLESSKAFTRELLSKHGIQGNPEYRVFRSSDGLETYLQEVGEFVVKPDGLTGGKGVKVYGEHLHSIEEALEYCSSTLASGHQAVVIEEKLEGEEFSLQSFCDGQHVVDTVVVQDHKRANDGDTGLNTGGMGSYSCADHGLPFLSKECIQEASRINKEVAHALREELGEEYKGILYGGFMVTRDGLRLIEYNARFGDPEVMNVLPLLKTDFVEVCQAIINGTLNRVPIVFERKATVCKYVVPRGYPTAPFKETRIQMEDVPEPSDSLRIYYAAVNQQPDGLFLTGSRAVAFVGIGNDLEEAQRIAEDAASSVKPAGLVHHRKDIGTWGLVQKRIDHMKEITEKRNIYPFSYEDRNLSPIKAR